MGRKKKVKVLLEPRQTESNIEDKGGLVRLSERGHRFVRYADDCNIYVRSERAGQRVMASLTSFIEKRLKQKSTGTVRVTLADNAVRRLEAELNALTPRNWGQSIDDCIRRVNAFLRGWLGYFAVCNENRTAFD